MNKQYILITGASKGIGKATALYLDEIGFHVFAGVRKQADFDELNKLASDKLTPVFLDVTSSEQITATQSQIEKEVGDLGLFGLVNNAGVAIAGALEFLPLDELRNQMEINLIGQLAVIQAFLPLIRISKGRIINISSIGGQICTPMQGPYHISKFALEALNETLRLELKGWNIKVIGIRPGTISTPIWDTAIDHAVKVRETMPEKHEEYYGVQSDKAIRSAKKSAKIGIAPIEVAKVIKKALTKKRPNYHYYVGKDAKIVGNIILRLPKKLRDRLILAS